MFINSFLFIIPKNIARKTNDKKNEKKYLALLAKYAPTENERLSAQARLSVLK